MRNILCNKIFDYYYCYYKVSQVCTIYLCLKSYFSFVTCTFDLVFNF